MTRAYGRLAQLARTSPRSVSSAARVLLDRDAELRLARLRAAATDAVRERIRPSRDRMRALVARPGGRLGWRSVPAPGPPGTLAAVVRPLAVATCDLDRPLVLGDTPFPLPLRLGHECVAEVVTAGSSVRTVQPGDRVVVPFEINCGFCPSCRAGLTGSCLSVPPVSMYGFGLIGGHWGGAYADLLAVPYAEAMLVPLPPRIDPVAAASVADTVCDGYRHVGPHLPALLARDPDASVLIVSALRRRHRYSASTALYAGLVARALGARQVMFADARSEIRAEAAALGFEAVRPSKLPLAPLVVDVSAAPSGIRTALSHTAPDGICSSAGTLHHTARIPASLLYGRNVTFHIGRAHTRTLIPRVLDLMRAGVLHPETVTTCVAPLDEAPSALREHMYFGATKTILVAPPVR